MSSPAHDGDLSSYERARLANIARNRAMLQQLGLADADASPLHPHAKTPIKTALSAAFSPVTLRKAKRETRAAVEVEGLRRSTRLLSTPNHCDAAAAHAAAEVGPRKLPGLSDTVAHDAAPELDYTDNEILLPEQLDDFEFEVYTMLRAWRLTVCRPLEMEPYKVFQNRTLVEAVRRRRNDESWGSTQEQLLECWGIGPVKVPHPALHAPPPTPPPTPHTHRRALKRLQVQQGGYAWQLVEQMQLPDAALLLQSSRDKDAQEHAAAVKEEEARACPPAPAFERTHKREDDAFSHAGYVESPPSSNGSAVINHDIAALERRLFLAYQPKERAAGKRPPADDAAACAAPSAVRVTRARCIALQQQ
jgi:hypothetical protein